MFCTSCGARNSATSKFCASCGAPISAPADDVTFLGTDLGLEGETIAPASTPAKSPPLRNTPSHQSAPRSRPPSATHPSSSDPISGARFASGQVIADRYRVVALAGRGGMGEVYRAEDLKLSQVVAIKFLPESLSNDAEALSRFHSEVRTARQVSHPNVCRVFDIGDVDGVPYLTMEYVDGEDLASVVRRIGRLSPDKAVEVARQLCAGLAAAHDRGVIHRDLKPANVMLDGAGKIRITDFGLAGLAASFQGSEVRAGTPAYMAPEQLEGREVTTKSDLYSLGLVLYEILTGKRAFEAQTLPELIKLRESGTITQPSTLVKDLDPLVERVILRCLAQNPADRPSSALQVAAALPGGDPLAAALAAGETPSPEMVAASGTSEGLRPRVAVTLLAIVLLGLFAYLFTADRYRLNNLTPLENSPEVLNARAKEIIKQLGFTTPPADSAYGLSVDDEYFDYIHDHDLTSDRWKILADPRPASMYFWYRQSPRDMQAQGFFSSGGSGKITADDPPLDVTGMISLRLDTEGKLTYFRYVPAELEEPATSAPVANWQPLFTAAGLDSKDYHTTDPRWTPLAWGDSRAAWLGAVANRPGISERLEASSSRGRPIYFEVLYPWNVAYRDAPYTPTAHQKIAAIVLVSLFLGMIVASVIFVRRNLRLNRGDTRGAARLSNFVFVIFFAMWLLRAHHLASIAEFNVLIIGMAWAFLVSSLARILYLALEPFVRKNDPRSLIGWSRLLGNQLRDPLVGRDLLIGVVYGLLLSLFETADNFLLPLFGKIAPSPSTPDVDALVSVHTAIGSVFRYTWIFVLYTLLIFFLLFLVKLVVKKDWIAAIVIVVIGAGTNSSSNYPVFLFFFAALVWLSIYLILRRFGLLTLVVGLVVQNILVVFPLTSHLNRWYGSSAIAGLVIVAALAVYSFKISLAGQPLFSPQAFDK